MSKQDVIQAIQTLNPTATTRFLMKSSEADLQRYLDRMTHLAGHRGGTTRWDRTRGLVAPRPHRRATAA